MALKIPGVWVERFNKQLSFLAWNSNLDILFLLTGIDTGSRWFLLVYCIEVIQLVVELLKQIVIYGTFVIIGVNLSITIICVLIKSYEAVFFNKIQGHIHKAISYEVTSVNAKQLSFMLCECKYWIPITRLCVLELQHFSVIRALFLLLVIVSCFRVIYKSNDRFHFQPMQTIGVIDMYWISCH